MKHLALVAGTLLLAGCGSARYPANYLLNLPPSAPQLAPAREVLGPLVVREFRCPEYLCDGRIVYRPSTEEVGFYEYHRWATDPRHMITQFMADALRAEALFSSVAVHERGIEAAYVLSGTIERLEEVDQGDNVYAVCTISVQLLNAHTRSVIWRHSASEAVPVEERNVAGLVGGLSTAARITVHRLVASVVKELQSERP